MALTEEQIEQGVTDIGMAVIGLLEQVFEALKDDPATPKDESKVELLEGLRVGGYFGTTTVPSIYSVARGLDGVSKDQILAACKERLLRQ